MYKQPVRQPGASSGTRCAIYTRKSHEEGLEQEFNSLDAQREACEAYITSQRHEGWEILPGYYDDGGISGATMDRPALQRLLADIAAGRIDVVVVYKVDRLTRALADFARIVDIFDAAKVSFVSVTQAFNTTTSMGRLTLNVLLSFAQFEREVTAERIRDKIAASKKKGMWMGGNLPLGYDSEDRKLVINNTEAETVRHIFRRYVELGSVARLRDELEAEGIVSKIRISAKGLKKGGAPFTRGALYHLLKNEIYRGKITHKGTSYPGEHLPVVDQNLWNEVQAQLTENRVERRSGNRIKSSNLLTGLLFDGAGHRLTPSHSNKKGQRYRYYVSRTLISGPREARDRGRRLPARGIETLVTDRLYRYFGDEAAILGTGAADIRDLASQQQFLGKIRHLRESWSKLELAKIRQILLLLIDRVEVFEDHVDIRIDRNALPMVDREGGPIRKEKGVGKAADIEILHIPAKLKRTGMEMRMLVDGATARDSAQKPDRSLVRLLAQAKMFQERALQNETCTIGQLAKEAGVSDSYFTRILRLNYLAPDIVRAILTGAQPPELTARKLVSASRLPLLWQDQLRLFSVI
ncbi:MAG: recombinase family protein [Alphaproteobacteria bacterium]|nr:MAG: recombinase family protein [Alphaproteobacteria bacterium]